MFEVKIEAELINDAHQQLGQHKVPHQHEIKLGEKKLAHEKLIHEDSQNHEVALRLHQLEPL